MKKDMHYRGVNWGRDPRRSSVCRQSAMLKPAIPARSGRGTLNIVRGIEVGHIFSARAALQRSHERQCAG